MPNIPSLIGVTKRGFYAADDWGDSPVTLEPTSLALSPAIRDSSRPDRVALPITIEYLPTSASRRQTTSPSSSKTLATGRTRCALAAASHSPTSHTARTATQSVAPPYGHLSMVVAAAAYHRCVQPEEKTEGELSGQVKEPVMRPFLYHAIPENSTCSVFLTTLCVASTIYRIYRIYRIND